MFVLRIRAVARIRLLMFVALGLLGSCALAAQDASVTEITPHLLVFSTSTGNVVCSVGDDGALLIGTPSAASTTVIAKILAEHTTSPVRYVVIAPEDLAHSHGDAGWGKRGAFVAMQENALHRLGGHLMGTPPPLAPRLAQLGVDRPRVAFSEVLTFDLNGEAVHVVHQKPGFSDADAADSLTYSASLASNASLPGWLSFDAANRTFSGNPSASDTTPLSIKVTASDSNGGSVFSTFVLTLTSVNDVPTVANAIANQTFSGSGNQSFQFANDTFADGDAADTLTYTANGLETIRELLAGGRTTSPQPRRRLEAAAITSAAMSAAACGRASAADA